MVATGNLGRRDTLLLGLEEVVGLLRLDLLGGDLVATDRAMELTRQSLTNPQPFQVDTKAFPSSVMNNSAAQCATSISAGPWCSRNSPAATRRSNSSGERKW